VIKGEVTGSESLYTASRSVATASSRRTSTRAKSLSSAKSAAT
jgi:hypothetical protein